jgi:hypothetical protein
VSSIERSHCRALVRCHVSLLDRIFVGAPCRATPARLDTFYCNFRAPFCKFGILRRLVWCAISRARALFASIFVPFVSAFAQAMKKRMMKAMTESDEEDEERWRRLIEDVKQREKAAATAAAEAATAAPAAPKSDAPEGAAEASLADAPLADTPEAAAEEADAEFDSNCAPESDGLVPQRADAMAARDALGTSASDALAEQVRHPTTTDDEEHAAGVGEVTNAKGDSSSTMFGKEVFEGKEYDYVFDINVNGSALQLPFNCGDDPWMAAQQWIRKIGFHPEASIVNAIVNHIIRNALDNPRRKGLRSDSTPEQREHTTGTADERMRVRARGGEEATWSRKAARNAGTLKDLMDDAPPEDGVYPVPAIAAWTLDLLGKLSDPDSTRPNFDKCSMPQLMELVEGALFLDANRSLFLIQCAIAQRLNGQRAINLCVVLGASSDFDSAEECAAALAEPLFLPEGYEAPQQHGAASSTAPPAPLRQPSLSGVPATEDAKEAALALVDVATLCELKGVNRSWRALARRILCLRVCPRDGQQALTQLDEITDLDAEKLIEGGRRWEVAIAGRMLPRLARLHGYGFVVDLAAVRAVDLQRGSLLLRKLDGGAGLKEALMRCISKVGEVESVQAAVDAHDEAIRKVLSRRRLAQLGWLGSEDSTDPLADLAELAELRRRPVVREPPLELTIAAIACAGSGVVWGVPVQRLREETKTETIRALYDQIWKWRGEKTELWPESAAARGARAHGALRSAYLNGFAV